ncbi:LuxR family transcriptional regulator [Methylovirgula sp. 4M-Z18]|nr:LuxR family transcriptional regulator [Methylovirgula sp. 4M-Z18]
MLDRDLLSFRDAIHYDSLIVGAGDRQSDGTIRIGSETRLYNIDPQFVIDYGSLAQHDVIGQLFAMYPHIVQVVAVEKYRQLRTDSEGGHVCGISSGRKIADYLLRYGFHHLLLAGLESSYGLAWTTLYRKNKNDPFTAEESERAKYLVPTLLYRWQSRWAVRRAELSLPATLLPLTAREVQIAALKANGLLSKNIADRLNLETSTVEDTLKKIKRRLHVVGRKLCAEDLQKFRG